MGNAGLSRNLIVTGKSNVRTTLCVEDDSGKWKEGRERVVKQINMPYCPVG